MFEKCQALRDDWAAAHPSTAHLVVEVAVTSQLIDESKAGIYAETGAHLAGVFAHRPQITSHLLALGAVEIQQPRGCPADRCQRYDAWAIQPEMVEPSVRSRIKECDDTACLRVNC